MKKALFVILILCFFTGYCFSDAADDSFSFSGAPWELSVHLFAEFDFSHFPPPIGPMAEFIILPFAIKTGDDTKNYLGFGVQGGAYFLFAGGLYIIPVVAGIFVGRFMLSRTFIIDMDARLGAMLGDNVVLYGASGIGLKIFVPMESRIYLGIEFTGNPYHDEFDPNSPELIYSLVLAYGIYIKGSKK